MNGLKTSLKIGLQILAFLADARNQPVSVRQLSEALNQSEKYLEQLLLPMRRARFVMSTRGPHGGYQLARPPAYITLSEIVNVLQGPITFCDCATHQCRECVNPVMWQALEACVDQSLGSVTLADVISGRPFPLPPRISTTAGWVQGGLGI
ncbi:MAG: Rrf2 family transcriptional regulator [Firmicutes bacterium]|nr:Rrf2 family transcriptional regulator [Bacillota bacterium]